MEENTEAAATDDDADTDWKQTTGDNVGGAVTATDTKAGAHPKR